MRQTPNSSLRTVVDQYGELLELPVWSLKTKTQWRKQFRKIHKIAVPLRETVTNQPYYTIEQTDEFTPTVRQRAYRAFEELFRRDSCNPEKWIYEKVKDGERIRRTEYAAAGDHGTYFQRFPGNFSVSQHLSGKKVLGIARGEFTRTVKFDLDNHHQCHDPNWHLERVMTLAQHLVSKYPSMKPHAEVNPRNGSTKLILVFRQKADIQNHIIPWLRELVAQLDEAHPHFQYGAMEVFPLNLPQVLMPLRPDKITVVDTLLPTIAHYCLDVNRKRKPIQIYSVEGYVEWINDADRPSLDLRELRSQLVQSLDWHRSERVEHNTKRTKPARGSVERGNGMGAIEPYKNNFLSHIIDFKEGRIAPDTIGKYTTPIERYLIQGEGLSIDATRSLVEAVLASHTDVSYCDRLTENPAEFERTNNITMTEISVCNGYQPDSQSSTEKLREVRKTWRAKGIDVVGFLKTGDRTLLHRGSGAPAVKVRWDVDALEKAAALSAFINCDVAKAREFLEVLSAHIVHNGELAIDFLRTMMRNLGIKVGHRNKAPETRQWLEQHWLIKVRNHVHNPGGKGIGSCYALAFTVQIEEVSEEGADTPVSILSVPSSPEEPDGMNDMRLEYDRLTIDDRFQKRRKHLLCFST